MHVKTAIGLAAGSDWMLRGLDDVAGTADWLTAHRKLSLREALPALIMRLDRLTAVELSPEVRLELMHLYKRPILKACAALPNPDPRLPNGGFDSGPGLTVEQRLDRLMRLNFSLLFHELDRKRYRCSVSTEENRQWVLRNLVKFFRRQVRYALLAGRAVPKQLWQDLHDLFVYLVIRGNVTLDSGVEVAGFDDGFDAEIEYKRLLLLGFAHQRRLTGEAVLELLPRLPDWARSSRLTDPGGRLGLFKQLLVEVSHDRPMRVNDGTLADSFRGWVMLPADGYVEFLARHARSREERRQLRVA